MTGASVEIMRGHFCGTHGERCDGLGYYCVNRSRPIGQLTPRGPFRQNACPRPSFRQTTFCFLLSDEKLLGRFWVLIRTVTALRRLVATTL